MICLSVQWIVYSTMNQMTLLVSTGLISPDPVRRKVLDLHASYTHPICYCGVWNYPSHCQITEQFSPEKGEPDNFTFSKIICDIVAEIMEVSNNTLRQFLVCLETVL